MARGLIINADDFGIAAFAPAITTGFKCGFITSASLLVNRDGTDAAAGVARARNLPIGLHLNLTTGVPVAGADTVTSLLGPDGKLLGERELRVRLLQDRIRPADVAREYSAQLNRFRDLVGSPPTHLDGHHHVHVEPLVAAVIAPQLRSNDISRIRLPMEDPRFFSHISPDRRSWASRMMASARATKNLYAQHGCRWPDEFLGMGLGWADCTIERLDSRLSHLGRGTAEYMVHVARADDVPRENTAFGRHHEYDVISSPDFSALLATHNVHPMSFADL